MRSAPDQQLVTESSPEHSGRTSALSPAPLARHAGSSENPGRKTTLRLRYAGGEGWRRKEVEDRRGEAAGRQNAKRKENERVKVRNRKNKVEKIWRRGRRRGCQEEREYVRRRAKGRKCGGNVGRKRVNKEDT